jgi:hypothetical protein
VVSDCGAVENIATAFHYNKTLAEASATGEKTPLFGRFYTKNEHFTKTGSGQT